MDWIEVYDGQRSLAFEFCHFVLETELQMSHVGAWRSYKNLTVGLKNRVQMLNSGTTPNCIFQ